eukprot:GHVT01038249.1.p2 GENE.GHVT01038249.1~~GHVT01038249.1.p2  ORF type:complete len:115 (-),score=9.18 GHVT01038249.1:901-1245(-)
MVFCFFCFSTVSSFASFSWFSFFWFFLSAVEFPALLLIAPAGTTERANRNVKWEYLCGRPPSRNGSAATCLACGLPSRTKLVRTNSKLARKGVGLRGFPVFPESADIAPTWKLE